ncbi:hypothetical protein H4R19_006108, partial [Coemansia spiralis]
MDVDGDDMPDRRPPASAGSAARDSFPLSLSDQASLFDFHAPPGVDMGALGVGIAQTLAADGLADMSSGGAALDAALYGAQSGAAGMFAGPLAGGSADAARARLWSNVLYGMGPGGVQPLDGLYAGGSMVLPPGVEQLDRTSAISGPPGLQHMAAGFDALDPLNLLSGLTYPGTAFPLLSPISPFGGGHGAEQATATASAVAAQQPRVDQACKMCRRRKVR